MKYTPLYSRLTLRRENLVKRCWLRSLTKLVTNGDPITGRLQRLNPTQLLVNFILLHELARKYQIPLEIYVCDYYKNERDNYSLMWFLNKATYGQGLRLKHRYVVNLRGNFP